MHALLHLVRDRVRARARVRVRGRGRVRVRDNVRGGYGWGHYQGHG